jgi:hypothetical protein
MNDTWVQGIRFDHIPDGERIAASIGYIYYHPVHDHVIARVSQRDKSLMGGVVFTQSTGPGGSAIIHSAGFHPNWVNRTMLWLTFDYPFNQIGVEKLFGQVPANNAEALKFNENLGFTVEHVIKGVYPEEDMLLMSIVRDKCRFLKMRIPKLMPEPADG